MAERTIFPDEISPTIPSAMDSAVILGTVFSSSVPGSIVGIRFWRDSSDGGTSQAAAIYALDGSTFIDSIESFPDQTSHGWQRADFETPIPIDADSEYIVAVLWPSGGYPSTSHFFSGGDYVNSPLTAPLMPIVGANNGRYIYGGTLAFPENSFNDSCYFSDVIFDNGESATFQPAWAVGSTSVIK